MENNESQNSEIQQAYFEGYRHGYKEGVQETSNTNKKLIESKDERINDLKERISDLKERVNDLKKLVNTQKNIIQYNQYNIESPGGTMSNPIHSGSGDIVGRDKVVGNQNNTSDFKGATLGGGVAQGDYTGDVTNNYPDKALDETVNKINQLIEELSQKNATNNTSDNMKIAVMVVEKIENNITWKQKAIQACQKGLLEGIKTNTIGAFVAGAIEGWKTP